MGNVKVNSDWIRFERREQTDGFINGAVELCAPLFAQLTQHERPFFFHHWLHTLNMAECFLLSEDGRPAALVTYPKVKDVHYDRWQVNGLAVRADLKTPVVLPRPIEQVRDFTATCAQIQIADQAVATEQVAFARRLGNIEWPATGLELDFTSLTEGLIEPVRDVFSAENRQVPGDEFYLKYYLPTLRENIRHSLRLNLGWCFCATIKGTSEPVGAVFFSGWELPLAGVHCALVDDIVVLPEHRRKGIATALQAFAYSELAASGVGWVCGNIDPSNEGSRRQAAKLGRTPWTVNVRVGNNAE